MINRILFGKKNNEKSGLKTGLYHFQKQTDNGSNRIHLRLEKDYSGLLLINANRSYKLNPTAGIFSFLVLHESSKPEVEKSICKQFSISKNDAWKEYIQFKEQIEFLLSPEFESLAASWREISDLPDQTFKQLISEIHTNLGSFPEFLEERTELFFILHELTNNSSLLPDDFLQFLSIEFPHAFHAIIRFMKASSSEQKKFLLAMDWEDKALNPLFEQAIPFSNMDITCPNRMDLALTYHCNNSCAHCYNEKKRQKKNLSTESWKMVLDRCFEIGVPHIIFTGGEPTIYPHLVELIEHAENNGQITGMNSNGRLLKDLPFTRSLERAGLDHIQITFESSKPEIHNRIVGSKNAWEETVSGIKNILQTKIHVMTNTTILNSNKDHLVETIDFLADIGIRNIGINSLIYAGSGLEFTEGINLNELPGLLRSAVNATEKNNQKLIWYTPTQYCHFDPVLFDHEHLGVKSCSAAFYNMCIEPDGEILPCQSYYQSIGNILTDEWQSIWNHTLSKSLRDRSWVPEICQECELLDICGGGCPLAVQSGKQPLPVPIHFLQA